MATKTIYFRGNGDHQIGLGHIYRLLSLKKMVDSHFTCVFLLKEDNQSINSIISTFFTNIITIPVFGNLDDEAEYITTNILGKNDIIVCDGYVFQTQYQKLLKQGGAKVVSIDDLHENPFCSDVIINHGASVTDEFYSNSPNSKLLLGAKYVILRKEFLNAKTQRPLNIKHIFICFGGSDYHNLTLKFARFCEEIETIEKVIVVTGKEYKGIPQLKDLKKTNVYTNLSASEMLDKIHSCGIAIAPSSGIGYEIIASKTAFLSGFYVNNQMDILKGLEDNGCILNLGDLRYVDLLTFKNALAQFDSTSFLINQINNQSKLIDGLSGERILSEFLDLSES